ncbi:hypothetical protein FIBSPDRAFT_847235 [Athelia psychrophila]|uniref:Uncharacterized protein n=1 Tax=Athelia psychrophila TaxID=1759441 RepID=A0A166KUH0_9AGAM|nr:hypothetical protein FIBSPDRAFT_859853 [Fibularhizoctonia sp. CBS 109695]KZP34103.1 hypothetical protein FIBSPDRAFT_847235 [Fibularhizoctonia sp. CBS 109695]
MTSSSSLAKNKQRRRFGVAGPFGNSLTTSHFSSAMVVAWKRHCWLDFTHDRRYPWVCRIVGVDERYWIAGGGVTCQM